VSEDYVSATRVRTVAWNY